ncbi:DMT family transporter [Defluviimonas aestuarii]|uniref:DMT family transporter n=1 Tax=Albidovulum aestuarii TaxID=1130726 RepID=UPI00249BF20C|nr:DMT family transporter [Defluviimonas aestuarii]MDI3337667.1 DMT family transporter [Defluviimonas aestuarii]
MSGPMRGHLAMLLFSALVAGSFSLGALMANLISPTAFTALRFLLAGVIIGSLVFATTGLTRQALAAPWRYAVLGTIFASYFILMFEGLKTAPAVSAAAVFTLTPVLSAGFGWLLLRQVTTPRIAAALAIGALGALWVIFRADIAALMRFEIGRGEAIYFVGCVAHAIYTPLVRRLNRGESPLVFTFGMLIAGSIVTTIYGWVAIRATDWSALPMIVWVTLAYTTIFASAATFLLLQYATLHLPSSKVMAYTYLTPSWVILWQIALGQTAPPLLVAAGVALTALALILLLKEETPALRGSARSS